MDQKIIPSYLKYSPVYDHIYTDKIKIPTKLNKNDSKWLQVSDDELKIVYGGK